MKAVGFTRCGGPEVLEVVELPEPQPGPGEVRIRVHAATVNPADTGMRAGEYSNQLAGNPPPWIPGMEAAGTIDALGSDVTEFSVGEGVMAVVSPARPGAYASQIVLPVGAVARQPVAAGHAAAATIPMNGLTAIRTLDMLSLPPGSWLGVTGAAGALGGYLIQLAKHAGLRVAADASPADYELVRSLGADAVVERGDDVAKRFRDVAPDGLDAVADAAILNDIVAPAIRDGGALAVFRMWSGALPREISLHQVSVGVYMRGRGRVDRLRQLADEGVITLRVAEVVPAERAAEAHRRLEAGGIRGRLVLQF